MERGVVFGVGRIEYGIVSVRPGVHLLECRWSSVVGGWLGDKLGVGGGGEVRSELGLQQVQLLLQRCYCWLHRSGGGDEVVRARREYDSSLCCIPWILLKKDVRSIRSDILEVYRA